MDIELTKTYYECIWSLDLLVGSIYVMQYDDYRKCIEQYIAKGIGFHQMFHERDYIKKSKFEMTSLAKHIARYYMIPKPLFEYLTSSNLLLNTDEQFFIYLMDPESFMCLEKFKWVCQKIIIFFDKKMIINVGNVFHSLLFVHSMIDDDSLVKVIEYLHSIEFNFRYTPEYRLDEIDFDLDTVMLCERLKLKKCVAKFMELKIFLPCRKNSTEKIDEQILQKAKIYL